MGKERINKTQTEKSIYFPDAINPSSQSDFKTIYRFIYFAMGAAQI